MLSDLQSILVDYATSSVSRGYVVALAALCLLQYAYYVFSMKRTAKHTAQFRDRAAGLQGELQAAHKDWSLINLEKQILCEFVSQTDVAKAVELLLRRFVPNPENGFAALLQSHGAGWLVTKCRGMSSKSRNNLQIDEPLLERLRDEQALLLEGAALVRTSLLSSLSLDDRKKVGQIFLLAVRDDDELAGAVITTSLCPPRAACQQQMDLATRLMTNVAVSLKRAKALEHHQNQLRSNKEMLELRSIIDRMFDKPMSMTEEFLTRLTEMIGADRMVLYLAKQDCNMSNTAVVRCGMALQPGIESRWTAHEDLLADAQSAFNELRTLDAHELQQIGVDSLIGTALVVPLIPEQQSKGLVCFTKRESRPFLETQRSLVGWAIEFLSESMHRAFAHARIERQAQQDGLTQLANRRSFDQRIDLDLQHAQSSRGECSLLLLDLDRFKLVNDTYGHQTGDEVLRVTAGIIRDEVSRIRSTDRSLTARYGGEEIAVLLPGIGTAGAMRIAESIRNAVEASPVRCGGHSVRVTLSAGIATCPNHASTAQELIAVADAALYQAKQSGRNRVCLAAEALVS